MKEKCLSPFEEATNLTQGQNVITSSFVIPCVRGLRKSFQLLSLAYNSKMVDTLKKSIDNRLSKYEDDAKFKFATTLDPRFKLKWCNDEEEKKLMKAKLLHVVKEKQSAEKKRTHHVTLINIHHLLKRRNPVSYFNFYLTGMTILLIMKSALL